MEPVGLGPVAGAPSAGQELPAVGDGDEEAGVTHAVAHTALAAQDAKRANVTAALSDAQVAAIEYGRLHPEAEAAAAEFASTHPPVRRTSSVLFPAALLVLHPPPPRLPPTPPPPDDGKENKRLGASAVHQVVPVLSREKAAVYVRQSLGLHWDVYARHRRPHQPPPANRPDSPACDGGGAASAPASLPPLDLRRPPPRGLDPTPRGMMDAAMQLSEIYSLDNVEEQLQALRAAADVAARAADKAHAAAMVSPLWARKDVEMALRRQEEVGGARRTKRGRRLCPVATGGQTEEESEAAAAPPDMGGRCDRHLWRRAAPSSHAASSLRQADLPAQRRFCEAHAAHTAHRPRNPTSREAGGRVPRGHVPADLTAPGVASLSSPVAAALVIWVWRR